MSSNPFVVLGVRPDADDAELKRACFRKLREHPPETDPEEFQAVQEAFDTLRDPARRHAAMQPELPQRLRDLMRAAMTSHSAAAALELLERAVSDFPEHVPAHVLRAGCLAHLKPAERLELDGVQPELAHLFEVAMSRKRRLLDLMSKDLIETEQSLEPLQWTPSSNA